MASSLTDPVLLPEEMDAILDVRDDKPLSNDDKSILVPAVFLAAWFRARHPEIFEQGFKECMEIAGRRIVRH